MKTNNKIKGYQKQQRASSSWRGRRDRSFFLFFRECSPSFHNSEKGIADRLGQSEKGWASCQRSVFDTSHLLYTIQPSPVPDVMSILCRSSSSLLIFSSSSLCTVSNSSSFSLWRWGKQILMDRLRGTWFGLRGKSIQTAHNQWITLGMSYLPVLAGSLDFTLVLVLHWLQT